MWILPLFATFSGTKQNSFHLSTISPGHPARLPNHHLSPNHHLCPRPPNHYPCPRHHHPLSRPNQSLPHLCLPNPYHRPLPHHSFPYPPLESTFSLAFPCSCCDLTAFLSLTSQRRYPGYSAKPKVRIWPNEYCCPADPARFGYGPLDGKTVSSLAGLINRQSNLQVG